MEYQNIVNPCIRDCDIMDSTPCGMDFSACPPDFIPRKNNAKLSVDVASLSDYQKIEFLQKIVSGSIIRIRVDDTRDDYRFV